MADLAGEVEPDASPFDGGYVPANVGYPGEELVNIVLGSKTLREVLVEGLAKREGWLAKYPFVIIEDALEAEGVDIDATRVVFLISE